MSYAAYPVVAVLTFLIGGFWYSPAGFLNAWARESNIDLNAKKPENAKHPAIVFGLAYLASVVAAYVLAHFMGGTGHGVVEGLKTGALVGAALVATSFAVNYAFGSKSFSLWCIDAGFHVVQFTAFGAALGAWPWS